MVSELTQEEKGKFQTLIEAAQAEDAVPGSGLGLMRSVMKFGLVEKEVAAVVWVTEAGDVYPMAIIINEGLFDFIREVDDGEVEDE